MLENIQEMPKGGFALYGLELASNTLRSNKTGFRKKRKNKLQNIGHSITQGKLVNLLTQYDRNLFFQSPQRGVSLH